VLDDGGERFTGHALRGTRPVFGQGSAQQTICGKERQETAAGVHGREEERLPVAFCKRDDRKHARILMRLEKHL
jgi:hypothetical protein